MATEKTLGGDRLGSGKKMKVHLHGYERSTHDLGYLWRSTMSSGTLVPFIDEIALPGDTFDIDLDCDIKTHPTIGPLFGSYKVQLDVFLAPIRLYNSALHNNALNIGRNMSQIKLPQIRLSAPSVAPPIDIEGIDIDNMQINPSCILSYLGIRGIGWNIAPEPLERTFNITSLLAYWDIYKNYYSNKQEELGAVIHTPGSITGGYDIVQKVAQGGGLSPVAVYPATGVTPIGNGDYLQLVFGAGPTPAISEVYINIGGNQWVNAEELATDWVLTSMSDWKGLFNFAQWGAVVMTSWRLATALDGYNGEPKVDLFPLTDIDDMRVKILAEPPLNQFILNDEVPLLKPYRYLFESPSDLPNIARTQEGLGVKTYQSDLFNNWISTDWIDGPGGISEVTAIDTSVGDMFTLDTLNLAKKVYNMLNRIAVGDGTYRTWLETVYDHYSSWGVESPMYMGGLIKELVFQEVVSNSESQSENLNQPLGTLAGKGIMSKKHKGGHIVIKVDEPSIILGIISLTPRVDYSQGNKWHVHLDTLDDLHKPALDEIGFQELITEQMAWFDTQNLGGVWTQKSAGKQPAWINYMTNVNKTYGNFAIAKNEMFMTLNRRYEFSNPGIGDLTTYIDPVKFNFIFANTALDAQNFWAQIAVDMTSRRKMSARVMPNL